jgi:hypothetical protein
VSEPELSEEALDILRRAMGDAPKKGDDLVKAPKALSQAGRKALIKTLAERGLLESVPGPPRTRSAHYRTSAAGLEAFAASASARALARSIADAVPRLARELGALAAQIHGLQRLAAREGEVPVPARDSPIDVERFAADVRDACTTLAATTPLMGGKVRIPDVRARIAARGGPGGQAFDEALLELLGRGLVDLGFASDGLMPDAEAGIRRPGGLAYYVRWKGGA